MASLQIGYLGLHLALEREWFFFALFHSCNSLAVQIAMPHCFARWPFSISCSSSLLSALQVDPAPTPWELCLLTSGVVTHKLHVIPCWQKAAPRAIVTLSSRLPWNLQDMSVSVNRISQEPRVQWHAATYSHASKLSSPHPIPSHIHQNKKLLCPDSLLEQSVSCIIPSITHPGII